MMDLSTEYLGLKLKNPLVVSSSPLTESVENILRLEDAGAAAVVLPSIFEEQLTLESNALDRDISRGTESFAESLSYFPTYEDYRQGQDSYLGLLRGAKSRCSFPIIASLNGATAGGVGALCQGDRTGRPGRSRTEYLFAGDGSFGSQRDGRAGNCGTGAPGKTTHPTADRGKTFFAIHQHSAFGPSN